MIRKIIKIDVEKCNGCGACARACHEGAIEIVGGKARLAREDYCDGLGDCLPGCPCGAISFEEREAPAYNEAAVLAAKQKKNVVQEMPAEKSAQGESHASCSQLGQWPCQVKLAPINAPYFQNAELLIAADCTAFAYANIHNDYMRGKITLIGCPKLDAVDYSEKLTEIIKSNNIQSVTVLRMQVPCCGGIEMAAKRAVESSGKKIPVQVVVVSIDGKIV